MFGLAIWDKDNEWILEIFQKSQIYPKICLNQICDCWLITPNQQKTHFIETNSGQLQNNTVKDAMSITISRVIITAISFKKQNIYVLSRDFISAGFKEHEKLLFTAS